MPLLFSCTKEEAKAVPTTTGLLLLSIFAKIFDKLVRIRLSSYIIKINFLGKNQFGFGKGLKKMLC